MIELLSAGVPVSVLAAWCAVLGLLVGSHLTVVIHRVPDGRSVVLPASGCPGCQTPIRPRDNVPVLSWLLLRGRCRACAVRIPARYPLVELGTGVLFGLVALHLGWSWELPVFLYLAAIGVALAVIDLDVHRLPDVLVLPAWGVVPLGLVLPPLLAGDGAGALAGAAGSALLWGLTFGVPWLATAGRGMGFGDVKLAPVLGFALGWLGWGPSLVALLGGFFLGTLVGVTLLATARVRRGTPVPYGPFMLAGAFFGLVLGDVLARQYLSLTGLA